MSDWTPEMWIVPPGLLRLGRQVGRILAAQEHYGVRRVTARQYRAWKRMQGRRG